MLQEPPVSAADFVVHDAWPDQTAPAVRAPLSDAALLEAFCDGAGLDPSHFVGEDAVEVARRAGAIYRQTVLGLAELMHERSSLKGEFGMSRTTVGAANNNPFKWAEPHRVAVDLLRVSNKPFLSGAAAVNASFQDLKKHLLCLMAGSRAAVMAAFEEVSPAKIGEHAKAHPLVFKAEACWREFQRRYEHATSEARENPNSAVNSAFKRAYEDHVRTLDGLSAP
jgi:type VI secretion system FHA domain protein